jgi:hypothetical protein
MPQDELAVLISLVGLTCFFLPLLYIAVSNLGHLFLSSHGWSHRLAGAALLLWLCLGLVQTVWQYNNLLLPPNSWWLYYDTVLGLLGITTTLTAARDFPHKLVKNAKGQSGSLSSKALVTQAEMVEHSFYQGLNLLQAWYLHRLPTDPSRKLLALYCVTSPWLLRGGFPVHSFSHNWQITPESQRTPEETILYRIKKAQYLFYKHVLLHGVNISVALQQSTNTVLPTTTSWRVYWLALNTSYVMEFFLQTLVRRNFLVVNSMFRLQKWLMASSSVAAVWVLKELLMDSRRWWIPPIICLASLALNFANRHHDVFNVMAIAGLFHFGVGW